MKTFFRVKLLLLPMAVFWVLAERYPAWAAPVAFLLALAVLGTQVVRGDARLLEKTEVPLLGVLALASACRLNWITAIQIPLSFIVLGTVFALTVIAGRPWTAIYSASQWSDFASNPSFHRINQLISAVAAVISVAIGLGQLLQARGLFFGLLMLFGAAFLILGPLVLNGIELRAKGKEDKV
jgi:hypothetical protein